MKLRRQQVEVIAARIIDDLIKWESIEADNVDKAKSLVKKVIIDDFNVEDKLNDEVRELLEKISSEMRQGSVEYHKMFRLVKEKLIRERNLIL